MKSLIGMLLFILGGNIALTGYTLLSESQKREIAKYILEKFISREDDGNL